MGQINRLADAMRAIGATNAASELLPEDCLEYAALAKGRKPDSEISATLDLLRDQIPELLESERETDASNADALEREWQTMLEAAYKIAQRKD
jgi:hypothetical protein